MSAAAVIDARNGHGRPRPESPPPSLADAAPALWSEDLPPPVPTGLQPLDDALDGGLPSEGLVVLNGGTGAGKSAMAIQVARHAAVDQERPVVYWTTELSARQVAARAAAQVAQRPWPELFRAPAARAVEIAGYLAPFHRLRVVEAACDLDCLMAQFRAVSRAEGVAPILVVDYLQHLARRLGGPDPRQAVSLVADALLALARSERTTVFALSAVSRGAQARRAEGTRQASDWLASAKESGDIEYGAALVMGLEVDTGAQDGDGSSQPAQVQIAKNRFGRAGQSISLRFFGSVGMFTVDAGDRVTAFESEVIAAVRAGAQSARAVRDDVGGNRSRVFGTVKSLLRRGHLETTATNKLRLPAGKDDL